MAVPADVGEEERKQEMNGWYRAEIRWAVLEEGKQGLREWKDAIYFFRSDGRDAFQQALEIGHRECQSHEEDGRWVETRLAQIVSLACMGDRTEFEVWLEPTRATERMEFDHEFNPEARVPLEIF